MQLTINNKNYPLRFGLGFLKEMNKRHSAEFEGVKTGYGAMALFNAGHLLNDPLAFVDLIRSATVECPQKPSNEELESYIEELILSERYDAVLGEVVAEVKKSPLLIKAMGMTAEVTTAVNETAMPPATMMP
ncbi:tail assembly chaperone [Streptococcus sp. zg-JUN1979]|uniref:tail assembly chaperone n=1 Tax=Streptococcus sp. zg-JUN1979 TaxID=3391450 RepID=UPI0039A48EAC